MAQYNSEKLMELKNHGLGQCTFISRKCLRGYDKDTYYRPGKRFDYGVIRVDEKYLTQLSNAEKNFLKDLGLKIYVTYHFWY